MLASLRRADFDLVFSMFPPVNVDAHLEFEALYVSRSGVHARADHALAQKASVSMAELAEYGWVVPNQLAVNRVFRTFFTENGLPVPRQVIRTTSLTYLKQAMLHSGLLSILPEHLVADEVAAGDIVQINNADCAVESLCGIITRQNRSRPPAVMACIDSLRAICREKIEAQGGKGDPSLPYPALT
ncbi:MAG: LysR substrate-binding domain-containing protein [Rhodospirillaceae bacterium]